MNQVQLIKSEDLSVTTHASLRDVFPELNLPVGDWKTLMPDTITICPVPGMPLTFNVVSKETNLQRNTWVGKNSIEGASLTFTATNAVWDGVLTLPGANQYAIHADHYGAKIVESFDDMQHCTAADITNYREGTIDPNSATAAADTTGPVYNVDILIAYTTASKTTWGNTPEEVANRYASFLVSSNTYLTNSLITNLRFNVVGAIEISGYTNITGQIQNDLNTISDSSTTVGALLAQRRTALNADLVQFIVDGTRNAGGFALIGGAHSVVLEGTSAFTTTHELAHNLGCRHNRESDGIPDTDTNYYFGFSFVDPNSTPYPNQSSGTIMADGILRLPYFSNPNVTYHGIALGVPVGQPKAAYNARTIQENAARVAAYKVGSNDPVITTQPANVTVTTGSTFTLSVVATGSNLTYQWYKSLPTSLTAIANATSASYSKTNAADADVAFYYVVVANNSGATQSSSASVSTTTPPPPPPPTPTPTPPSTGGGSGGGGGAPSSLYLLTLVVTTASKKLMQRKRPVT